MKACIFGAWKSSREAIFQGEMRLVGGATDSEPGGTGFDSRRVRLDFVTFSDFSRIFPMIGSPVRAIGKLSTTNFMKKYNNYLRKQGADIFPLDRYKREENIPKQFHLIKSDFASKNDLKSIEVNKNVVSKDYPSHLFSFQDILLYYFSIDFALLKLST